MQYLLGNGGSEAIEAKERMFYLNSFSSDSGKPNPISPCIVTRFCHYYVETTLRHSQSTLRILHIPVQHLDRDSSFEDFSKINSIRISQWIENFK
jgi:hypothetical protein